jgi:excinuclease UvrABC helicase subunit UvrB
VEKALRELPAALRDEPPTISVPDALGDKPIGELASTIAALRVDMLAAAEALEFEHAAELRDQLRELERLQLTLG